MKRSIQCGLSVALAGSIVGTSVLCARPARAATGPGTAHSPVVAPAYTAAERGRLVEQLEALQGALNAGIEAQREGYERQIAMLQQQEDPAGDPTTQSIIQGSEANLRKNEVQAATRGAQQQTQWEAVKDFLRRGETLSFVDALLAIKWPAPRSGDPRPWLASWRARRADLVESPDHVYALIQQLSQGGAVGGN